MKKLLVIVAILALVVTAFAGCSKNTACDECGKEAKCEKITFEGESGWFCPDCAEEINAMLELVEQLS